MLLKSSIATVLCSLMLLSQSTLAVAADAAKPDTSGFSFGGAFGTSDVDQSLELQLRSPVLAGGEGKGFWAQRLSLIGSIGTRSMRDVPVENETKLQRVFSDYGALGVRLDLPSESGDRMIYSNYEALYIAPDAALSDEKGLWGGRLGFGAEFMIPSRENFWGVTRQQSFFVQTDLTLGVDRANELAGEPDLYNGFGFMVGSRTYF